MHAQLRPISPSPPRKTIRTGAGRPPLRPRPGPEPADSVLAVAVSALDFVLAPRLPAWGSWPGVVALAEPAALAAFVVFAPVAFALPACPARLSDPDVTAVEPFRAPERRLVRSARPDSGNRLTCRVVAAHP
jgi:hypothetical protein